MHCKDLLTRLRDDLSESVAGQWTDAQLIRYLDRAYVHVFGEQVILFEDWCLKRGHINIVANTDEYDLLADLKKIRHVQIKSNDEYYNLERVYLENMSYYDTRSLASITPVAMAYYLLGKKIGLVPTPATSLTDGLRLYYIPQSGQLHLGTATAGSGTTLTMAADATDEDDAYLDMDLEVTAGTGVGERAQITGYVGATKVATVDLTTTPDGTTVYAIYPKTEKEFDEMIVFRAAAHATARIDMPASRSFDHEYRATRARVLAEMDTRDRKPRYAHHMPRDMEC